MGANAAAVGPAAAARARATQTIPLMLVVWPPARPPFLRERFVTVPPAALLHLLGAAIALAVGPVQLSARLRTRSLARHRGLGRAYVLGVLIGGVSALVLATISQGGLPAHFGFGLLAVLWLGTTALAYRSIRAKDQAAHRLWMIRSYALTFAAVTLASSPAEGSRAARARRRRPAPPDARRSCCPRKRGVFLDPG